MAYTPKTWTDGETITADKLNTIEQGIKTAQDTADGKQDTLTVDASPTSGSSNPVASGGVYSALAAKVIPTALPNPNKLTLTGAVSAEYDGSEAVSVAIPSGGSSTANGLPTGGTAGQVLTKASATDYDATWQDASSDSGGTSTWRLINTVTVGTDVDSARTITIDTDSDGASFALEDFILIASGLTCSNTSASNANIMANGAQINPNGLSIPASGGTTTNRTAMAWNVGPIVLAGNGAGAYGSKFTPSVSPVSLLELNAKIASVGIQMASASQTIETGTLTLYGR